MEQHTLKKFNHPEEIGEWYDNKYTEMGGGWVTPPDDVMTHLEYIGLLKMNKPTLLDIGCGGGHFIEVAKNYADCTGIELSVVGLTECKKRCPESKFLYADIEHFKPREKFDIAVSIGSIEHTLNIDKAMKNIYKNVVKSGGFFYAYAPNELWQHFDQPHEQTHTDEEWEEIFTKPGFKIVKKERINNNTRFLLKKDLQI